MIDKRQKEIIETLFAGAGKILFGLASVELKIHEGRIVAVTHSVTENTRHREPAGASNAPPPLLN